MHVQSNLQQNTDTYARVLLNPAVQSGLLSSTHSEYMSIKRVIKSIVFRWDSK